MNFNTAKEFYEYLDVLSLSKTPFFFSIDFNQEKFIVKKLDEITNDENIRIDFPEFSNTKSQEKKSIKVDLKPKQLDYNTFLEQYKKVHKEITLGNSYLLNLSFEVPLDTKDSLRFIFSQAKAKYKILVDNQFLCFSPETFIKIKQNKIHTFPMKGTIDASIPNAKELILENEKEKCEHYTIVDLLRNDISQVASNVEVKKFRYIDKIKSNNKELLQVSSDIQGDIKEEFQGKIGSVLEKLLPAGSVTGAPKKKTVEIIKNTETHNRNFYTGIAGVFDGEDLDT